MSVVRASGADFVLLVANLVTPWIAIAYLVGGIVLARSGTLNRSVGAFLVVVGVPVLWPGVSMTALAVVISQQANGANSWIAFLLPDAILLGLVGGASLGLYWLATRRQPLPH